MTIQHTTVQRSDGAFEVSLTGKIDERFEFAPLVEAAEQAPRVVLRLGGVRSISSLGMRTFEGMVLALQGEAGRPVELVQITPALATQMALIPNLCQGALVSSAVLPFACATCGHEAVHEVPWRPQAHLENAPACVCGKPMALDGLAEQYLPAG